MGGQLELSCTRYNLVRLSTKLSITIETYVCKDLCTAKHELKQKKPVIYFYVDYQMVITVADLVVWNRFKLVTQRCLISWHFFLRFSFNP